MLPVQPAVKPTVAMHRYGGVPVPQIGRQDFLERWKYNPGEHLTILGYTQSGKTTLGFQLLESVVHPKLQAMVLVMKPRDKTVSQWGRQLGLLRTRSWPAFTGWRRIFGAGQNGYLVWPSHTFDPDIDDPRHYRIFRATMLGSYKSKKANIIVADEAGGLAKELHLEKPLKTLLSKGSSMGTGVWEFTQRPVDMPALGYNGATHLFFHQDPDKRNRERLREIGGRHDPKMLEAIVTHLPEHHFLYIHRNGGRLVIEP